MSVRTRRVRVAVPGGRAYDVRIGSGTLEGLGAATRGVSSASRAFVITVPPVGRRYGARVERSLRAAGFRTRRLTVPDGDRSKNLRQAATLYEQLLDAGADRGSLIVALGGGVAGDLAGFVAATLLRGVDFVQVPTTMLAMIDSSVGGKTGVNLKRGKNLVGAFHQPRLVYVDAATLGTLPPRQRAAGMAEVIKHGAIWDLGLFERLEKDVERMLELDDRVLVPLLARAVKVKAEVVARDEREAGLRMLLNFGHTLGHAVEAIRRYRGILHGEAVSMGMAYAAGRSEELGLAPAGTQARLVALLDRAGLPTELPDYPRGTYLRALRVDKKKRDANIRFVVLRGLGKADTVPLRPEEILPARRGRVG